MAVRWNPVKREDPLKLTAAEFVGIINKDEDRAEYVRRRVPELQETYVIDEETGKAHIMTVMEAMFTAAAEYHKGATRRAEYTPCTNQLHRMNAWDEFPPQTRWGEPCGRPAKIHRANREGHRDMAYCEHCRRWMVLTPESDITDHPQPKDQPAAVGLWFYE